MRTMIAVGVVCLVFGILGSSARAQERARALHEPAASAAADDSAPASVELSLSIAPSYLMMLGGMQLTGSSGTVGGLGSVSALLFPTLDVGVALERWLYLVLGVSGSYHEGPGGAFSVSVPVALLWYLETPRIGHVMPMLRVGVSGGYAHFDGMVAGGASSHAYALGALVRGGLTWMAARELALRAELGIHGNGSVSDYNGMSSVSVTVGFDAVVGVVLRL